jgi:predicted nucleic acid-binding protein
LSFLLDTNVLSELRKGPRANQSVRAWFGAVHDDELFLSVLVLGEVRQGVERVRGRDAVAAKHLEAWLRGISALYAGRILPVDDRVADVWGRLNVPDPISMIDGLLAATALVHDLTLVTRNTRHVARTGVATLNPFVTG